MIEFARFRDLENAYSSNAGRAGRMADQLHDAFPRQYDPSLPVIQTSPDDEATIQSIQNGTRDGDLLLVRGGDKTVAQAFEAVQGRDITVLALHGGNGNDAAHDLTGKPHTRPVHELITKGEQVQVHLTNITIEGIRKRMLNYFEAGSNPKAAALLNSPTWRRLPGYGNDYIRSTYENLVIPPLVFFSRRFPLNEADDTRQLVNLSIIRSRTAAKHGRFPVSLAESRAFMTECADPFALAMWGLQAIRGNTQGTYLELHQERRMQIGRTILCHIDAEAERIEKGSVVQIQLSGKTSYAVSTPGNTGAA